MPIVVSAVVCQLPFVETDIVLSAVNTSQVEVFVVDQDSVVRPPCSTVDAAALKEVILGDAGGPAGGVEGGGVGGLGGGAAGLIVGPTPGYTSAPKSWPELETPIRLAMSLGMEVLARKAWLSLRILKSLPPTLTKNGSLPVVMSREFASCVVAEVNAATEL